MFLDEKEFENIVLYLFGYLSFIMVDYFFEYVVDGIMINDNVYVWINFEDFFYFVFDFGWNVLIDWVEIFGILDVLYFCKF